MKLRSLMYAYVYLLESQGLFKIGYSYEPEKRRKQIQTGSPFPVKLVHTIRSPIFPYLERELHDKYCSKKVRGEWFALDAEDVARIKTLNSMGWTPEEAEARRQADIAWANRPRTDKELEEEALVNGLMNSLFRSMEFEPPMKDVTPDGPVMLNP